VRRCGIADAQIGDQAPYLRRLQRRAYRIWVDNRHPTDPNTGGPRGEPQRIHRCDGGILQHLRHRLTAQPMAAFGFLIGKDSEMNRRIVEAGKLELGINRRPLPLIVAEGSFIRLHEIVADRTPPCCILDQDKPPRLAIADGGRQTSLRDKPLNQVRRNRIGLEVPYIAAPNKQRFQLRTESVVEYGRRLRIFRHGAVGRK